MKRRPSMMSCLLATAGVALLAAAPLMAAERSGGGLRQPLDSPPGIGGRSRDPGPGPLVPPGPGGINGPAAARRPPPESRPPGPSSLTYRGTRYLISGGQWYERRDGDLVAVVPPAGVMVKDLPQGYSMRWIGGVPYFYADGLYYVWRERPRRYEILTAAPAEVRTDGPQPASAAP